jgi:heterodisulfide reductase subunit C
MYRNGKVYGVCTAEPPSARTLRFPGRQIIECALLQDGAVVKKSEGSAALAA